MRGREVLLLNGMICIAYGGVIYRGGVPPRAGWGRQQLGEVAPPQP
jgi:hypothetical protein